MPPTELCNIPRIDVFAFGFDPPSCLPAISDRRIALHAAGSPGLSQCHSRSARVSSLAALLPFLQLFFLMMLIRSGISILYDHPRLYSNNDCTPGTEWIRMTPITVPTDRVWAAKENARYITPIVATPGYHHTVGIARSWHFLNVYGFIVTGILFVVMLFDTEQWRRLVPRSLLIFGHAWNTCVHYATFHLPPEPNGFYAYNPLQQLAYFSVVFVLGPLVILTGIAMSPAVVNRFPWYARLFGRRQSARSLHFLTMIAFLAFIVVHVALVAMTGFVRNMNHIVLGNQ